MHKQRAARNPLFRHALAAVFAAASACACADPAMPGMDMHHMTAPAQPCEATQALACADTATPAFAPDGALLLTWTQDHGVYVARSADLGHSWSLPQKIGDVGAGFDGGGDARPQIAADAAGHVLVAFDRFKDQHWDAEIWLARSADDGMHFDPAAVFEPGAVSQRLPVLDALPSGGFVMLWQDKRLSKSEQRPGASIAYAWSDDGGATFTPSAIAAETSCECCRIALSTDATGLPIAAFRTIFPGSVRDHVTLGFQRSGPTAPLEPAQLHRISVDNWVTDACPHQGPSVAVSADGSEHVVWYTQGKERQGLFYARSSDGGVHFGAAQQLGDPERMPSRPFVYAHGHAVWRVWKEFDGRETRVLGQQSRDDGVHWSAPTVLASATGRTDHPLLVGDGRRVYLSWLSRQHGYQLTPIPDLP